MKVLNFSHPLTKKHLAQIENLTGATINGVIDIASQIDPREPLEKQIEAMLDRTGLTPQDWQIEVLLINPPSLNYSAAALLAQLHGRMGYFPPVLRLRPDTRGTSPRFEVAEILNLQAMREKGREKR